MDIELPAFKVEELKELALANYQQNCLCALKHSCCVFGPIQEDCAVCTCSGHGRGS
jgi:hypothetical protein